MIAANGRDQALVKIASATSTTMPASAGSVKLRRRLATVTRRQAMIGPIPDRSTRISASGTMNGRNAGGPTDTLVPVTASEMSGKNVIQKITNTIATSTRFWNRNTASRDHSESSWASERSCARRLTTSQIPPITIAANSTMNGIPSVEAPNAWIESRIPERTRNVPSTASVPLARISDTFQIFSIPRFSWIMIEWMNAVAASHGISAAFSTASQAQ